jgi:hypothetical protein
MTGIIVEKKRKAKNSPIEEAIVQKKIADSNVYLLVGHAKLFAS